MQMPGPWNFWPMMNATIYLGPIAIFVFIFVMMRFFRRGKKRTRGFCMEAPRSAIPKRQRGQMRADGTEIRTVRLPSKCPNCAAQISPKEIEWVGPLEAQCNYCGSTVRAQFERV